MRVSGVAKLCFWGGWQVICESIFVFIFSFIQSDKILHLEVLISEVILFLFTIYISFIFHL